MSGTKRRTFDKFPFYRQINEVDCGATCLKMVAKYYGLTISLQKLHELTETTREGVGIHFLSKAAEKIGFRTLGVKLDTRKFYDEVPLPCIIFWRSNHFVVVYKIKKDIAYIADPAFGLLKYNKAEFMEHWIGKRATEKTDEGLALLLEHTHKLEQFENDDFREADSIGLGYIFKYLLHYKRFLWQLLATILVVSIINFTFPFLTQNIVDIGIKNQDMGFISLVLFAQIFLFLGKASMDIIKNWLSLHISTRINVSLISDFFIKLMKLPISYFDTKMTGDLMHKVGEFKGIESFLTATSISILISFLNLFVFGFVLIYYDLTIFWIFFLGSLVHVIWIFLFFKRRRVLGLTYYDLEGKEKTKVIEMINGMQEIKLYNAERLKRWGWEYIKARAFRIQMKIMSLENSQILGSAFINELKNIIVTFFAAKLVIDGEITLGIMLSVSYIIGQLNIPINEIAEFSHSFQDMKIRLERISDIYNREDEEASSKPGNEVKYSHSNEDDIVFQNVSFKYRGKLEPILKDINLTIPAGKTTAIVGFSGSGKTTMMKLLLKFYEPDSGTISVGNQNLNQISAEEWRKLCGVVLQEGFLFNDTIAGNIAIGEEKIDLSRLMTSVELANIKSFIYSLPQKFNTEIGNEGIGLSTGEKQRILIARALYKNPKVVFFDEATSALDAKNERDIVENLESFFENKTVVIIAHRLSTVKNADQVVVLNEGSIVESGNHDYLIQKKGHYYNLIKNQLELGT